MALLKLEKFHTGIYEVNVHLLIHEICILYEIRYYKLLFLHSNLHIFISKPYLRGPERPLQSSPPLSLPPLIPAKSMVSLAGISVISEEEQPLQPELERERALLTGV